VTELSIDTASEIASVALSTDGALVAEITWRCRRNHTVELLPTIERLLAQAVSEKSDLEALFACTGPGMYTGLRVGVSTAQGLAQGLGIPVIGVGRLELDAYPHSAFPGAVVGVHRAGRGDLAWAAYQGSPWREVLPPRLSKPDELGSSLGGPALLVGELDAETAQLIRSAATAEIALAPAAGSVRRAAVLTELGLAHLNAGQSGDPAELRPIYLRPPAIGPQPRPSASR
jgi:tRNA threonylcarbamoyladenosine biosynthesis protein TsaB